jgi:hypothetical protein
VERAAVHHPEHLAVEQGPLGREQRVVARERREPHDRGVAFVRDPPAIRLLHARGDETERRQQLLERGLVGGGRGERAIEAGRDEPGTAFQVRGRGAGQVVVDRARGLRLAIGDRVLGAGAGERDLVQELPLGQRVTPRDQPGQRLATVALRELAIGPDADALPAAAAEDEVDAERAVAVLALALPRSRGRREADRLPHPIERLGRQGRLPPLAAARRGDEQEGETRRQA